MAASSASVPAALGSVLRRSQRCYQSTHRPRLVDFSSRLSSRLYTSQTRRLLATVRPAPPTPPSSPPPTTTRTDVLERYRERLDRKAQAEGVAGGAEALLRERLAAASAAAKKKASAPPPPGQDSKEARPTPPPSPQADTSQPPVSPTTSSVAKKLGTSSSSVRPLSSFLDVEKAARLPTPELAAVWRLRHASDPLSLCAAVPARTYARMLAAARRCPQFVLPLPISGDRAPGQDGAAGADGGPGAELHFLQWQFEPSSAAGGSAHPTTTVLFTRLAEYKVRGEFALPHTTVTHYADLARSTGGDAEEEGLALMHGQVVADRGVTPDEARWLVVCLQRFYGAWEVAAAEGVGGGEEAAARAAERRRLLEWFASGDERFSVEKLMEEAERMG